MQKQRPLYEQPQVSAGTRTTLESKRCTVKPLRLRPNFASFHEQDTRGWADDDRAPAGGYRDW